MLPLRNSLVVVLLGLTFLMSLPTNIVIPVGRVLQNDTLSLSPSGPPLVQQKGLLPWSPFGPREQNLLITDYSDSTTMFSNFATGNIDITDWQLLNPSDNNTFCSNSDFFCTSATSELGTVQLDINGHARLMNIGLTSPRTTSPASFTTTSTVAACSIGFGSLTINLRNQETTSTVLDSLNTITASNQPSGSPSVTVSDSGSTTPNGIYNIPCLLAGTYSLTSSIYSGTVTVTLTSATATTGTFNVNWNSISNVYPTASRTFWGNALAHMIDKNSFANGLLGFVTVNDILVAPSERVAQPTQAQINAADCPYHSSWLNLAGLPSQSGTPGCNGTTNLVSAYNIVADNIGAGSEWWQAAGPAVGAATGYSGHDDLRAACDYLVMMGFPISPSSATCNDVANAAAGTTDPGIYPHLVPNGNIVYYIRTTPWVKQFGTIIADTLDFLFGTPMNRASQTGFVGTVCYGPCPQYTVKLYTLSQVDPFVFDDGSNPNGWQLYTGELTLKPTPDHFYGLFNSRFSGGICGGLVAQRPSNYPFYCNPQLDTDSAAGQFSASLSQAWTLFSRAAYDALLMGMDVPIYSGVNRFVENNGWNFQQCTGSPCVNTQSSIVNTFGMGTKAGFWTFLNARQVPGYNPCSVPGAPANCASNAPGGGNPSLIRRGISQNAINLSPFQGTSQGDLDIIRQIFDSMEAINPLTGGANSQVIDWQTMGHYDIKTTSYKSGFSSSYDPVTDVTTQLWTLRNYNSQTDLRFQDGNPLTANDVAYTILAYRDVPSASFQPDVANVITAMGVDCGTGQSCTTLQVTLRHQSPFYELGIGLLPILEKSVWAPFCGVPPSPASQCASPAFDPMAPGGNTGAGIMIGDGPWACVVPAGFPNAGHIGGSCVQSSTGALIGQQWSFGSRSLLTRYTGYQRYLQSFATTRYLYTISWADKNNDGIVNILDLADVALAYGTADPYWVNPNIVPIATTVGLAHLATVAIHWDEGIERPYTPSTLVGVDPCIDPFFQASPPC